MTTNSTLWSNASVSSSQGLGFQRLKTRLHEQMIESMDLSKVGGLSDEQLRREIRALAEHVSGAWDESLDEPLR